MHPSPTAAPANTISTSHLMRSVAALARRTVAAVRQQSETISSRAIALRRLRSPKSTFAPMANLDVEIGARRARIAPDLSPNLPNPKPTLTRRPAADARTPQPPPPPPVARTRTRTAAAAAAAAADGAPATRLFPARAGVGLPEIL